MDRRFRFRIDMTTRECREFYQGLFSAIQVTTHTGQTLSLPAHHIRPFIETKGVHGQFELTIDGSNKFVSLHKIAN
jgi:hypothetical protein